MTESALLKRIKDFPKISNTDHRKLRELGDLLLEVVSAKADSHLPGLSYLDTARGVNPIVAMLSYNLQNKWVTQGSRYKEENEVAFPPFSFFSKFIRGLAKTRNNPNFVFGSLSPATVNTPKNDKPPTRHSNRKASVSAHKTEVASTAGSSRTSSGNDTERVHDLSKQCPLHNRPHPLTKCRGFRGKPLEERRRLLKECEACFKCCSSTSHLAKDCPATIMCTECNSDSHVAALHPDTAEADPPHTSSSCCRERRGE